MSRTESTMPLPLGAPLPDFALPDVVSGRTIRVADFSGKDVLVVIVMCAHCPYVVHMQQGIAALGRDYLRKPVGIVAFSPNDAVAYPLDAPDGLRRQAEQLGFTFPYCYDESQDIARAFQAVCTPEFYVFDRQRKLVYRGQFDDSRRNSSIPVTGRDVRQAIEKTLAGQAVDPDQRPSIGCSIKWKATALPA